MASRRRDAKVIVMLFQIFVEVPALVMAEIAWYLRVGVALTCLIVLFAVAIAAITIPAQEVIPCRTAIGRSRCPCRNRIGVNRAVQQFGPVCYASCTPSAAGATLR